MLPMTTDDIIIANDKFANITFYIEPSKYNITLAKWLLTCKTKKLTSTTPP